MRPLVLKEIQSIFYVKSRTKLSVLKCRFSRHGYRCGEKIQINIRTSRMIRPPTLPFHFPRRVKPYFPTFWRSVKLIKNTFFLWCLAVRAPFSPFKISRVIARKCVPHNILFDFLLFFWIKYWIFLSFVI